MRCTSGVARRLLRYVNSPKEGAGKELSQSLIQLQHPALPSSHPFSEMRISDAFLVLFFQTLTERLQV